MTRTTHYSPLNFTCAGVLGLATGIFVTSFCAWLAAATGVVSGTWEQRPDGSDLVLALIAAGLSVTSRLAGRPLKAIQSKSESGESSLFSSRLKSELVVQFLGVGATLNWIGFALVSSRSLTQAALSLVVLIAAEAFVLNQIHHRHPAFSRLLPNRLQNFFASMQAHVSGFGSLLRPIAEPIKISSDQDNQIKIDSTETAATEHVPELRETRSGIDEAGRRFMHGRACCRFEEGQRQLELILGFSPVFQGKPQFDYEVNAPDINLRVGRISPQGIQLVLSRSEPESCEIEIEWYASEDLTQEVSEPLELP